ncbi:MAG: hypothetical protein JRL30_27620 [Deltaproteobacteria bacterium]|nr:hypothetical protein [Deltaproteobacteria bacterium]
MYGMDITRVDTVAAFPMGTKVTLGRNTYIYYEVLTHATYYAKGACSEGRPGLIYGELGGVLCNTANLADVSAYQRKMVLGLETAAVGTYCWFVFEGYKVLAKHDKTQCIVGQKFTAKDVSNSIQQIANHSFKDLTITARVQGEILTNSATNLSATGDNIIWVDLFGA